MLMARPDHFAPSMWEGRARMRHSWHFSERSAAEYAELRNGRKSAHPHGEMSRAIAERLLNVICPEDDEARGPHATSTAPGGTER